jgi:hypothetical protein
MVGGEGSGPGNEASEAAGIGSLELGYQTAIAAQHPPQPSIASPQAAPSRVVHQATTVHRAGQQGAPGEDTAFFTACLSWGDVFFQLHRDQAVTAHSVALVSSTEKAYLCLVL